MKVLSGAERISIEREREISVEGYTPDHDDEHTNGELIQAAVSYAINADVEAGEGLSDSPPAIWPWGAESWKPKSRIRDLERARALIAAEIDRLTRAGELP